MNAEPAARIYLPSDDDPLRDGLLRGYHEQVQRIRALEAAEVLLSEDYRDRLNPEQYERALACARRPLSAIHPEQASAILRLYSAIAGGRV